MTKRRDPLTFSLAITRVAGLLGWGDAAAIVDRSERTVRLWSESDAGGTPTLDQAIALDRAYLAAGGDSAPLLRSYALQLETSMADAFADRIALAGDIAQAARESAEAVASSIHASQAGASPTAIHHAIAETEEASGAITRLLGRLKSFLPGIQAGSTGEAA
ncbi:hypothetical protein SAMN06295912_102273 [Sphingomonas laterariae]|uniref:Uncharacterized protein n=1 Tax=Edaphosphingomonas laterariae TaxID=861865 RepID=A0A239CNF2_9SPHN|nr:hypothetical protein [Sphingomonas laterariae]SNS20873.1 hypothetical protein SAMN06295912_102273 [Sphingomonas laterariae]